jgi:hypothetical protein
MRIALRSRKLGERLAVGLRYVPKRGNFASRLCGRGVPFQPELIAADMGDRGHLGCRSVVNSATSTSGNAISWRDIDTVAELQFGDQPVQCVIAERPP